MPKIIPDIMDNLSVIIPIVQIDMGRKLLDTICNNTHPPRNIIVIDNSENGFYYDCQEVPCSIIRREPPLGVNASWNLGLSFLPKDCTYVSIFNDDIIINKFLFKRILDTFSLFPACGIVVPLTIPVQKEYDVVEHTSEDVVIEHIATLRRRQGWAFTCKFEAIRNMPPIPADKVFTFFGDDYIFNYVGKLGYSILQDLHNRIFHYGSITVRQKKLQKMLESERKIYNAIK